jgi:RHS repeat-associated protein
MPGRSARRPRSSVVQRLTAVATAASLIVGVMSGTATASAVPGPGAPVLPTQRQGSADGLKHQTSAADTAAKAAAGSGARARLTTGPSAPKTTPHPSNAVEQPTKATTKKSVAPAGFDAGTSVAVPSLGDAHSAVYRNADGTYTARTYTDPVRYRASDGSWAAIDTTLVRSADGTLHEKANPAGPVLGAVADDAALESLRLDPTHAAAFSLAGAAAVHATASGSTATYTAVQPGTDLEVTATGTGLDENLVLHAADVSGPWYFPLNLTGLTPVSTAAGIVLRDASDKDRILIPAGRMTDAHGASSDAVAYALVDYRGGRALKVSADRSWLTAPGRAFPVRVDPSLYDLTDVTAPTSTYVDNYTGANHSTSANLYVGSQDGGKLNNAYLNFPLAGQIPNAYVTSAALYVYNTLSGSCSAANVNVSLITSSWNAATLTAYPGVSLGPTVGSAAFTGGTTCGGAAWAWLGIDNTGLSAMTSWAGGGGYYGLALTASTSAAAFKEFASAASANAPYLQVDYSPYDASYSVASGAQVTPPVTANTDGHLQVSITNTGQSTWSASSYALGYQAYDSGGSLSGTYLNAAALPVSVGHGGTVTLSADIKPLVPGSYELCLDMAVSGTFFSAWGVSEYCFSLTVVNVPPQVDRMWPDSGYIESTLTPQLTARGFDDDAWPGTGLAFVFAVCLVSDPNTCPAVGIVHATDDGAVDSSAQWTVPAGKLSWNTAYRWTVSVGDGDAQSPVSNPSLLTANVPQPLISSQLTGNGGSMSVQGVGPESGAYTAQTTDAQVETAGPALSVLRSYDSLSTRAGTLFGTGWTTIYDMRADLDADGSGNVVVGYPDGQRLRFGRNPDGTYAPPPGRQAGLVASGGGWRLRDGSGALYTFDSAGRLAAVADADGRALALAYNADGTLATATNQVSGRSLGFTWTGGHVTAVTVPAESKPWTYSYYGDILFKVCPPTSTTACTNYTYSSQNHYRSSVVSARPQVFYRLGGDSAGTTAANDEEVALYAGDDDATASGVTWGGSDPLSASTAGSAGFDGKTSYIDVPDGVTQATSYLAIELWFQTGQSGGVLYGTGMDDISAAAATNYFLPLLYVGTDGRLHGQFADDGSCGGIASSSAVNDGQWHHAVLAGSGTSQTLYLDGAAVGSRSQSVYPTPLLGYSSIGAGFIGSSCPAAPSDAKGHFSGRIADVAAYAHPLTAAEVAAHYAARLSTPALGSVVLPSGKTQAAVTYDSAMDRANTVQTGGGTWQVGHVQDQPGTSAYPNAVLSERPTDYYRLDEYSGNVADSQVYSGTRSGAGTYVNVTLNEPGAWYVGTDDTAAGFNGSGSSLQLPDGELDGSTTHTVELWFSTTRPGVLFAYQSQSITDAAGPVANYVPALYVGSDGRLRGQFLDAQIAPITSAGKVTDGAWHHVVLDAENGFQQLYLDGRSVGTKSNGALVQYAGAHVYAGAGFISGAWPAQPADKAGHFSGSIDELAVYAHDLTDSQIAQHYHDVATLNIPERTVLAVDPAGKAMVYHADPAHGGRITAVLDASGGTTEYGYDDNGFLNSVTDPDDHTTLTENDDDGNAVITQTCRSATSCQLSYASYYENAADPLDPRNNKVTATWDARASSEADSTHETDYAYTAAGDLAGVTVPGTDDDRTTTYTYTAGSETAADSGTEPVGLLASSTTAGGAVTKYSYNHDGDLARTTDPVGMATAYTYDAAGHPLSSVQVSDSYPSGVATYYGYDDDGRLDAQLGPVTTDAVTGVARTPWTVYGYDPDGLVATVTTADYQGHDPTRVVTYTYDANDRVASEQDPTGATSKYTYDAYGNVATYTDALGNVYGYTYLPTGQQTSTVLHNYVGDPTAPGSPVDLTLASRSFDPAGRLATSTDAMGRTTHYYYFDDDLPQSAWIDGFHDADGSTRSFPLVQDQYDAAGNLTEQVTGNGLVTTDYEVDARDRVTRATLDPADLDRVTTYGYDADSRLTATTVYQGSDWSWSTASYDALGRPTSTAAWNGTAWLTTSWKLDQRGLPLSMTDPRGNASGATAAAYTTSYAYDQAGRLTATTAPPVSTEQVGGTAQTTRPVTTVGYDMYGDTVETKDPDGNVTTAGYDLDGRQTSTTLAAYTQATLGSTLTPTSTIGYDSLGRVTSATDALKRKTAYTYDQLGNTVQIDNPDGGSAHAGYDHDNELLWSRDPAGALSVSTYDDLGRTLTDTQVDRVPTAKAYTTSYTYLDSGVLRSATDPAGNTGYYTYNAAGELTAYGNPLGYAQFTERDEAGRPTRILATDGTSQNFVYDKAGNLASESDEDIDGTVLRTTGYGYDAAGNLTSVADPAGGSTAYAYDALNRVTGQAEKATTAGHYIATTFGYDADGNRTRSTDGNGNATTYAYNPWGLPVTQTVPATAAYSTPATRQTVADYDAAGQAVKVTQPGGAVTVTAFDPMGRVSAQYGTGAEAATAARAATYDKDGRMLTASAPGGTDSFGYDDRGDLVSASGPSGAASFGYDEDGRMSSRTDASGTTGYGYDAESRLVSQTDPLTGTIIGYGYDKVDQLTGVTYGTGGATRKLSYDTLHRLIGDSLTSASGASEETVGYGYDDDDRIVAKLTTGAVGVTGDNYGYDLTGRLTSWIEGATTTAYTYDDAGNRTGNGSAAATYDARDELLSDGSATYTYTARGTLSTKTPASGTAEPLGYDAFDRLVSDGSTGYAYDGLDRVVAAGSKTLSYSGPGATPVADGTQTYSLDPDGDVTAMKQGSTAQLALQNTHGDVTGTFTATGAALAGVTAYNPFGVVTRATGTRTDLGYQSGWTDPGSGRVNMAARWYDPSTGGFASRDTMAVDPVPSSAGNPFAYAGADPMDNVDPSGHWFNPLKYAVNGLKSAASDVADAVDEVGSALDSANAALESVSSYLEGLGAVGAYVEGDAEVSSVCGPAYVLCVVGGLVIGAGAYMLLNSSYGDDGYYSEDCVGIAECSTIYGPPTATPDTGTDPGKSGKSGKSRGKGGPGGTAPPPPPPPTPQQLADRAALHHTTRPGTIDPSRLPGPAGVSLADALDAGRNRSVDNSLAQVYDTLFQPYTGALADPGSGDPNGGLADPGDPGLGGCVSPAGTQCDANGNFVDQSTGQTVCNAVSSLSLNGLCVHTQQASAGRKQFTGSDGLFGSALGGYGGEWTVDSVQRLWFGAASADAAGYGTSSRAATAGRWTYRNGRLQRIDDPSLSGPASGRARGKGVGKGRVETAVERERDDELAELLETIHQGVHTMFEMAPEVLGEGAGHGGEGTVEDVSPAAGSLDVSGVLAMTPDLAFTLALAAYGVARQYRRHFGR